MNDPVLESQLEEELVIGKKIPGLEFYYIPLKVPNQEKLTLRFFMFFWKSVLNLVGVTSSILPEVYLWADTVAQSYNGGLRFRVTTSAAF